MLLFRTLRTADLIELCRSMRYSLGSGLMIFDVMDLLANHGTPRVRAVAADISKELKAGWSLQDALAKQSRTLPPLFISLATVGDESGNLPEVLHELEKYYLLQQKVRREFQEQIAWPMLQFVAAIVVITVLIYVLGILPPMQMNRGKPQYLDPLGLGLVGERGAVIFLGSVCGILLGGFVVYRLLVRLLGRRPVVERLLLAVPGVGPCLLAMAVARFCIAGRLMLETSLSILKTLRLAFMATDNAAFIAIYPAVEASLKQGNSIVSSFVQANLFPQRFLSAVGVGEESGKLPETLRTMGEEYDDEARRRLIWLSRLCGWVVWMGVAVVLITCIFSIFNNVYIKSIENAMPPTRIPGPPK
jgi:type IV pilus assembly protein PilC